jgi:hypothetical protein
MFCNHKFDIIQPDGYQYCKKCGKAFNPPKLICNHKLKIIEKIDIEYFGNLTDRMIVQECSICGVIIERRLKS